MRGHPKGPQVQPRYRGLVQGHSVWSRCRERSSGTARKESRAGTGREVLGRRLLTHHRAVDVLPGSSGAHLEDPGAQQFRVGAVGRCIAERGADCAEKQQQGSGHGAGPGTHAAGAQRRAGGVAEGGGSASGNPDRAS